MGKLLVEGLKMVYGTQHLPFLFQKFNVFEMISHQCQSAIEESEGFTEAQILNTPTEDLVRYLVDKYKLEVPVLDEQQQHVEDEEVKRQTRNSDYGFWDEAGGTRTVAITQVALHIPFSGESKMFFIRPSCCSIPGSRASVAGSELLITISADHKDATSVKSELQSIVDMVKQNLATLTRDVENLPSQIETLARPKIESRKQTILDRKNLVASLGFPMTRRANAPTTYVAPMVRRKITPRLLPVASAEAFRPEPALDEANYKAILDIMDNMTKVIERSPSAFVDAGEEAIRQHFLVQLNAQFEGQATGETFNASGKTDILIRCEDRNVFIAECKFWRGEKVYLETIDQLLSYLTWRDTKTALVIFNRNKNLSQVLGTIKSVTDKHPHKKRGPTIEGETRFRYIMGNPDDHNREIIMTVMVYDVPSVVE